jgi:hypothetical protein
MASISKVEAKEEISRTGGKQRQCYLLWLIMDIETGLVASFQLTVQALSRISRILQNVGLCSRLVREGRES